MLVHVTAGLIAGLAVLAHAGDTTEPAPLLAEAGYRAAANLREVAQGHMDAYIAGGGAPPTRRATTSACPKPTVRTTGC